jgi:hypothetical protein
MGQYLVKSLTKLGVSIDPCSSPGDEDQPVHANGLWMGAPSHISGWWKGQRVHCLTMWEATGVPPGFRENVHEIDTLIVPSEQNVELFSHWHDNVRKVPLGIDPAQWHYRERPPVGSEFRFMTAGQGERKGIDICVRAFQTVFGGFVPSASHPRPTLTVKSRPSLKDVRGEGITNISGTIPFADEIELYATAHAFLGLARGEGWGLMPFQAMAQGIPTILSDAHGHHEFAHLAAAPISCGLSKAEPFIFGDAENWWEPDLDEVCEAMWDMYCNYDEYLDPAAHSAQIIADEYTWDHSATKLIDAMGGREALSLPDITEREWHKPTIQQFLVITDKDCGYEVNGTVHKFKKGETYYVFGDLKRMMYENNNLDPACLDNPHESGLTPEQLDRLDRYRSEHERCYACGQRYNSDTSLDFEDEDVLELSP